MKKTAGISLMLLIFLSLCLITFSLLSLSGATADAKLAQNSADRTTEYYAAVTSANEILNEIDTQLAAALQKAQTNESSEASSHSGSADDTGSSASIAAYAKACGTISASGAVLTWEVSDQNDCIGTFQYDVAIKDDQILHVELSVVWPQSDSDALYQITCWQVVSIAEWAADTSQNLYRTDSTEYAGAGR